jgi:hypothetical protein
MKRQFEEEHPEIFGPMRCQVCRVEATDDNKGRRVSDDVWVCNEHRSIPDEPSYLDELEVGRLFFAGDDAELNDALDDYLTRTGPDA